MRAGSTAGPGAAGLLAGTLSAARAGLMPYSVVALTCHLPSLVWMGQKVGEATGEEPGSLLPDLKTAVIAVILAIPAVAAHAAIILGTLERMGGRASALGELLAAALARLLPRLAVAFTVVAAVSLGLFLLVVPGLFLACMLFVALPAQVVEGGSLAASLARSVALTRGSRWALFQVLIVIGLAQLGAVYGLEALRAGQSPGPAYLVGTWAAQALFTILTAAASAVAYARLRLAREGAKPGAGTES